MLEKRMFEESKFDLSIDRVKKEAVPLLVVGLGGTGIDTLLTIKKTFAERFVLQRDEKGQEQSAPPKTSYLGFDVISSRPVGLDDSEYVNVAFSGLYKILQDQENMQTPYEQTWVKRESSLRRDPDWWPGRQGMRLSMSRSYKKVYQAIYDKLLKVLPEDEEGKKDYANQLEIVVVTGIGGSTGSGIFLDVCQILRHVAKEASPIPPRLTGYVVMPDVSLGNVSTASGMNGPIKHNAYAALKELDFWMRVREHKIPYSMRYGDKDAETEIQWTEPPFDYCTLVSSSNIAGIPYKDPYLAVRQTIAENLLLSMAEEYGYVGYERTYRHCEDVYAAIQIPREYPLFYGYRTIGAFTKRIPKKAILNHEGTLLLKTFVPMRDDSGKLQPDRRMFTDGQGKARAESITGKGPQLMQDFRTNVCRLPRFCNIDLSDKMKVASVQAMDPAPHERWKAWRNQVSSPAALTAAEKYLEQAWNRFEQFATDIIMDPEQGPFALEAYLDAWDGLINFLEETLENWTNQYHKIRNTSIAQGEEMCNNSWVAFCHPPILGRRSTLEQYDHAIKTLYSYVCNCEFLEKHTEALRKLVLRVREYLRDGLKPLCASLEFLEKEFNTPEQDDQVLVQDIYNLGTVQQSIDDAFKDANVEGKLSSDFLRKMAEISLITQPNVDAKTSGVEFVCRSIGLTEICKFIQNKMSEVYGDVNNQSLDDIMVANVGSDVNAQHRWMDQLANSVLDGALPMFMQDAVFKSHTNVAYSYMSIPRNAIEHLHYIRQAFRTHDPTVVPIVSRQEGQLHALMVWDQLPLFRYGLFEELRKAYDYDLGKEGSEGIHLVNNGDPNADYRNDWSQLPSPKPYFLFQKNSVYSEEKQYNKVHQMVERGIRCGMIQVDEEDPHVRATIRVLYTADGTEPMTSKTILEEADRIKNEINPATGDQFTESETNGNLKRFLESGKEFVLEERNIRPASVAAVLGLQNEPCDPFDPKTKEDEMILAKARENHRLLCVRMTEAMIYSRPDLVRALELQLDAVEKIRNKMPDGNQWEKRKEYAGKAADIFLFLRRSIFMGGNGFKYKSERGSFDIVIPDQMAEDLKEVQSHLLKAVCFLADAAPDQAVKEDLTEMLEAEERKYNAAIDNGTMTKEKMETYLKAAILWLLAVERTMKELKNEKKANPTLKDILTHQEEVAARMKIALVDRINIFEEIAESLD